MEWLFKVRCFEHANVLCVYANNISLLIAVLVLLQISQSTSERIFGCIVSGMVDRAADRFADRAADPKEYV